MELVGEEKRIQTLFRELRLEDEHVTPRFGVVLHRAQSGPFAPRNRFKLSFVAATALLLGALVSLAWLTKQWQRSQQSSVVVNAVNAIPGISPAATTMKAELNVVSSSDPNRRSGSKSLSRSLSRSLSMRLVARRHAEMLAARRAAIRNAAAISSWQSPTTALLRSPGDEVLTSLPQLNKSVNELKSFLPSRSN